MVAPYLEKAYKLESISNYRRKSLSQKIRRDILKAYILFPYQTQRINKLISEFNRLTDNKYTNISDIFNYSYEDDFTRFLYNVDLLNQENNNPTNCKSYC